MDIRDDEQASTWQGYLAALPSVAPPAALRERMLQACGMPLQRRRRRLQAGSLAAGIVVALVGAAWWTHESRPLQPSGPPVVEAGSPGVPPQKPADTRLAQLDDVIAQAYASDLSEDELQTLWQARASLLIQQEEAPTALLVQL